MLPEKWHYIYFKRSVLQEGSYLQWKTAKAAKKFSRSGGAKSTENSPLPCIRTA